MRWYNPRRYEPRFVTVKLVRVGRAEYDTCTLELSLATPLRSVRDVMELYLVKSTDWATLVVE